VEVCHAELASVNERFAQKVEECECARADLHRHEQELKALSEYSPDIIARFDKKLRYLYVNPAIEPITGSPSQIFIGNTHQELGLSEDSYSSWEKICLEVFEPGQEKATTFD